MGFGRSRSLLFAIATLAYASTATPLSAATIEQDLETFQKVFIEQDRALTASAKQEAVRQLGDLRARSSALTPVQARLGLARIVALADNAGSLVLDDPRSATSRLRLPLKLASFADGLMILRTSRQYANLAGGMILEIDGVPAAAVLRGLEPYYGGLLSRRLVMKPMFLEQPEIMQAAGLAQSRDKLRLKVRTAAGQEVIAEIRAESPLPISFWPDRWTPEGLAPDWVHATPTDNQPLYLRDFETPQRLELLPELDAAYVAIKWTPQARSVPIEPFAKALRAARAKGASNLIIDLRFDHGGSTPEIVKLLMDEALYYRLRSARIWLITGRHTHESGIVAAAGLKSVAPDKLTIVGEDVGDKLAFWASAGRTCLEAVEACVVHAGRRFDVAQGCMDETCQAEYRGYRVTSLRPDVRVKITASDVLRQRDPMLDEVERLIRA